MPTPKLTLFRECPPIPHRQKLGPKYPPISRENGTPPLVNFQKTANSRELAYGMSWNNSGNPKNPRFFPRKKRLTAEKFASTHWKETRSQVH
jgi:hypothetical protein